MPSHGGSHPQSWKEGRIVLLVVSPAEIKPKEPVKAVKEIQIQKYIQRAMLNAAEDIQRSIRQFLNS